MGLPVAGPMWSIEWPVMVQPKPVGVPAANVSKLFAWEG